MGKKGIKCSKCGRETAAGKTVLVDGRHVCTACMYGNLEPFRLYPIGFVRNSLKRKKKGFGVTGDRDNSRIELLPSQKPFMHRIEEEKYLTIIYYLHESDSVRSVFKRGLDGKEVGVFSSRTPCRLSRLAVTEVELIKAEGTDLYVKGLDAVNGSPVVDIKLGRM